MLFASGTDCEISVNSLHWFAIIKIKRVHAGFVDAYDAVSCHQHWWRWIHLETKVAVNVLEVCHRYLFASATMRIQFDLQHHADLDGQRPHYQYFRCKYWLLHVRHVAHGEGLPDYLSSGSSIAKQNCGARRTCFTLWLVAYCEINLDIIYMIILICYNE